MSENVIQVTLQNFQQDVLGASSTRLVLVDFWADWCGPCKSLTPVLEKLAAEYKDQIVLAKVNSDQNQELAQHFQVRSLPTVKFFKKGALVNEFTGAQPEAAIREMIEQHLDREPNTTLEEAVSLLQTGQEEEALTLLNNAHESGNYNKECILLTAEIYCHHNELDKASETVKLLNEDDLESAEATKLQSRINISRILVDAPPPNELLEIINSDPDNLQALLWSSAYKILNDQFDTGLETLIIIMRKDKSFLDGIAQKTLVDTFNLLDNQHELVSQYRRKMASLLY